MATCSSADSVLDAASQIKSNATKLDAFVNGTASQTVQLGTGDPTPSLRKFVADAQDVVTQAALDAGQTVLDDVAQNMADIAALQSGKADKVEDAVEGSFAGLDASGNLIDSGRSPADITALEEAVESMEERKADKFVPADPGNLAELNSTGNLRDAGRAVEDFVLLLAYANGEALELATMNRMNIASYNDRYKQGIDRYKQGIDRIAEAGGIALAAAQRTAAFIDGFDEQIARHRLQVRLFDGTTPADGSKPVLFVICGQSNAVGCGGGGCFETAYDCGTYWSWEDGANVLKPIKDPTGQRNGTLLDSAWPSFARRFFALTGRKVILLNIASAGASVTDVGTSANTWADNAYGTLRSTRQTIWDAFHAAVPASSYDMGAILWSQGEAEASRLYAGSITAQQYKTATLDVFGWLRTLIGEQDCPVFLAKIAYISSALADSDASRLLKQAYESIQKAQVELCDWESIFMALSMTPEFVKAWSVYMDGVVHYSPVGYRIMGNAFARSVVNYLNF